MIRTRNPNEQLSKLRFQQSATELDVELAIESRHVTGGGRGIGRAIARRSEAPTRSSPLPAGRGRSSIAVAVGVGRKGGRGHRDRWT
jgi:hypothetical protein